MPHRRASVVDGGGKARSVVDHQLAHVLPGDADGISDIGQPDEVGCRLDQLCIGQCRLHIGERAEHGVLGMFALSYKGQRNAASDPDTHHGIVATGRAELFNQFIDILASGGQFEFERERVFHISTTLVKRRPDTLMTRGGRAMIDDPSEQFCVVPWVLRRAPDRSRAVFAALTDFGLVWAIHPAPRMSSPQFDAPAARLRMLERRLDFLLGMFGTTQTMTSSVDR